MTMKTAIIQHDIRWNSPEKNLQELTELLDKQASADLYVLAETFATGFLAEDASASSQRILDWMRHQAARLNAAVAGSVATFDEDGHLRNRLHFVRPDGTDDYYDKRHLFTPGGEADVYAPGNRRVVTLWRGVRILLQVCYDLRFPVFSRCRGDYDAILCVANWPASRRDVWQTLLKARAIENQCFVIGVNRVGSDPKADYSGDSVILDPLGRPVASCTPGAVAVAAADIDPAAVSDLRRRFPVLADADDFLLRI